MDDGMDEMSVRDDLREATWRDRWDVHTGRLQGKELSSFTIYDTFKDVNFV
jgi:hypothetical protein